MTELPLVLDHVGIAVRSLDAGQSAYDRLGFRLTPRSFHSGAATPGGPVVRRGSGNHCAMFQDGYLEILGITDPAIPSSAHDLLAKYEGAHIVAIGSGEAAHAHAVLSSRAPGVPQARALERDAPFGPEGQETRRCRFANIYADAQSYPEAHFIFIEHLTPEVLWQPHLLDHPNGAVGIAEVALVVPDLEATLARLGRLLGREATRPASGIAAFDLERGRLYAMTGAAFTDWAPGVNPPCLPWVGAVGFAVADLGATGLHLRTHGIPYVEHRYPAIWVGPEHTCGPVCSFIQKQP